MGGPRLLQPPRGAQGSAWLQIRRHRAVPTRTISRATPMEGGDMGQGPACAPGGTRRGWGREGAAGGSRTEPPLPADTVPMGVLRGAEPPCCPPAKWVPRDRITEYLGSERNP